MINIKVHKCSIPKSKITVRKFFGSYNSEKDVKNKNRSTTLYGPAGYDELFDNLDKTANN